MKTVQKEWGRWLFFNIQITVQSNKSYEQGNMAQPKEQNNPLETDSTKIEVFELLDKRI